MAKFYGKLGFEQTNETSPGIYEEEEFMEHNYYGELIRNTRRLEQGASINDDVTITNQISILADPFIRKNFHSLRYVTYAGSKWKVTSIEVQYPRLILSIGGEYNGTDQQQT